MEGFNQNYFTCAETPENRSLHKSPRPPPYRRRRHQLKVFDQRPYGTKGNGEIKEHIFSWFSLFIQDRVSSFFASIFSSHF